MFDLSLEPEGAGWLKVHVSLDGESWDFTASELGLDPCTQLVVAAVRLHESLAEGSFAETIDMYGEPEGMTLYVTEEEGKVIVRLYYIADADSAPKGALGECLKRVESSKSEVCEAVYRELRALLTGHGLKYLSAEWQEFPVGAFIKLHRALGHEPVLAGDGFESEIRCLQAMVYA